MAFLVLLLAQLLSAPPTPHIKMTAGASAAEGRVGTTIRLFVDVTPNPKVHVYAPGAKDYQPIALAITPRAGIKAGKLVYPKSRDWYFEPLKEHVPVFDVPFRLEQTITVGAPLKAGDRVTVAGVLSYQACDDAVCFNPVSAPVSWSIAVK
jgi:hypothetical protein